MGNGSLLSDGPKAKIYKGEKKDKKKKILNYTQMDAVRAPGVGSKRTHPARAQLAVPVRPHLQNDISPDVT